MITGKTTVRMNGCQYSIDVKFHVHSQKMVIDIPFTSTESLMIGDVIYARRINEIVIINETGQMFTAYECFFYERITKIDTITISGQYETLIKGRNIPFAGEISFHFDGLDCLFGECSDFPEVETFQKENGWNLLNSKGTVAVVSKISEIDSIHSLIKVLKKVREGFEFLIDREIFVDWVVYSNGNEDSIEIINDKSLMSKNDCLFNQKISVTPEKVVKDINQWLLHYDIYKEAIHLWKKTLYNRQVSEEDIFIWRCQSLELLCSLHEPLIFEAKRQMENPNSKKDPNLVHFLKALNVKCKFFEDGESYFKEVKDVRNVYTHYNPKKHISEREWWNASHLIEVALKIAIGYVMELENKDFVFFFSLPQGTREERRR